MRAYKSYSYIIYSPHPSPLPQGEGLLRQPPLGGGQVNISIKTGCQIALSMLPIFPINRRLSTQRI